MSYPELLVFRVHSLPRHRLTTSHPVVVCRCRLSRIQISLTLVVILKLLELRVKIVVCFLYWWYAIVALVAALGRTFGSILNHS